MKTLPQHFLYPGFFLLLAIFSLAFPMATFAAAPVIESDLTAVNETDFFQLSVSMTGLSGNTIYHLKCAFSKGGSSNYFAYTFNQTEWVKVDENHTKQLSITTDANGGWQGTLSCKVDPTDSGYQGPGNYNFKIGRYTEAGSGPTWSEAKVITIQATPTPTPTPTSVPIPTPTLTLTPIPTVTPTPTATVSYSSSIFLNEFLSNPETGENEWVELYNAGDQSVDLSGWKIDDIEGGSSPQTIESGTVIDPKGYLVIYFSSAKLNNSGDTVRLLDPAGAVHDAFSYGSSQKGWSWAKKIDGSWQETSTPTPGQVNQFNQEDEEEEDEDSNATDPSNLSYLSYSIFNARQQKLGSYLSVEGIISAPPEILGSKTMFIEQDGVGIKIKLADLDYSQLDLGDKVEVKGELKESFQEKYLKDSGQTVTFLAKGTLPEPHKVKTGEINEDLEGRLVVVNAEVVETSGSTFYLDDGSGSIKIYIKSTTEIEKPKMKKGYFAKVVGIVSQYKDDYRILPRFQEDLLVSDQPIADEQMFEGESFLDPPEADELLNADGEVLGAATELPATGVSPEILFDSLLAVILFVINLLFRRILTT